MLIQPMCFVILDLDELLNEARTLYLGYDAAQKVNLVVITLHFPVNITFGSGRYLISA